MTLSRPCRAPAPSSRPSPTPGLRAAGTSAAHARAIRSAADSSRPGSRPIAAAGTIPNGDRAENRPPMLGTPRNTARYPEAEARSSSADPGSVIATKREPAASAPTRSATRAKK